MNINEKLQKYIDNNLVINPIMYDCAITSIKTSRLKSSRIDVDDYINETYDNTNFQKELFKLIDERNLIDSDVYNKVHIDRRLFSKIRNDVNYHPSKETIILLGLSLELNETEIDKLLNTASYSLPKNNKYDLIIRFCFIEKIFNIMEINELLETYNCKLLNN